MNSKHWRQFSSIGDQLASAVGNMRRATATLMRHAIDRNSISAKSAKALVQENGEGAEIQNCDSGVSTSDEGAYLRRLLNECASGNMSSNMALFHVFCTAPTSEAAKQAMDLAISEAAGIQRLRLLSAKELWEETPNAFALVKSVI